MASSTSPATFQTMMPMILASTSRRIFASRSATSRYSRAFSSEMAACEATSFSTAIRAGLNARAVRLFSR